MVLGSYYNRDKPHAYMDVDNYDRLMLDHLKKMDIEKSCVLEIGSGFGRYTKALSMIAKRVVAVEPNQFMFEKLSENFKDVSNVTVLNMDISNLLKTKLNTVFDCAFMFHTLHHLPRAEYSCIKKLVDQICPNLVIVEPNHLNPLYLLQPFFQKEMNFKEEKYMFRDNSSFLMKSCFLEGYFLERKYLGLLPQQITNTFLKNNKFFTNSKHFMVKNLNPFSIYSIAKILKKD